MRKEKMTKIKNNHFPPSLFVVYFAVLLLMSGIHTGLIVGMNKLGWNEIIQSIVPLLYWGGVAAGLTIFTRKEIRKHYEKPMHQLADATKKVAEGDFSVYVPTIHTADKMDYLDVMLVNFNKMVEELGSIETLKTDFFSNVSHEFKTPLAVIYSNAQMLQKETEGVAQQEYAVNILDSTRRLSDLIQNMLKLNKLEKQTIHPVAENYDVCAQICACAVQFEESWEQKQIEFEAELEDCAFVWADPGLLELVWNNLLSNAIKFTPEGGTVRILESTEGNRVVVSVSDTGCGIKEEEKRHIFDKFYQGDSSHSTVGNGLGLALVKRILELSDAEITVQSEPQKGATFVVVLPLAEGVQE